MCRMLYSRYLPYVRLASLDGRNKSHGGKVAQPAVPVSESRFEDGEVNSS